MKVEQGKRPVRVHLLNGEALLLVFDPNTQIEEVLQRVCSYCEIKDHQFFGLVVANEKDLEFLARDQRLSKYAPKSWRKPFSSSSSSSRRRASSGHSGSLSLKVPTVFELDFKVQFFVEHPHLIRDIASRHNYYLHMRKNVLASKHRVNDEVVFTLAACSLHLECGSFDERLHTGSYFNPHEHVPQWFIQKWNESVIIANLPSMHRDMVGTDGFDAEGDYIKNSLLIEDVPCHTYKLYKTKSELTPSVVMAVHQKGVRFTHTNPDSRLYLNFEWNKIGCLNFKKKRFEILPSDVGHRCHRLVYFTHSSSRSKYILGQLKDAHSLQTSLAPYMDNIRKSMARAAPRDFRVSYIYGIDPNGAEREVRVRKLERDGISLPSSPCNGTTVGTSVNGVAGDNHATASEAGKKQANRRDDEEEEEVAGVVEAAKMSRGSSHTSGIESDSKLKHDDVTADEEEGATPLELASSLAAGSLLRSESQELVEINDRVPHTTSDTFNSYYVASTSVSDDDDVNGEVFVNDNDVTGRGAVQEAKRDVSPSSSAARTGDKEQKGGEDEAVPSTSSSSSSPLVKNDDDDNEADTSNEEGWKDFSTNSLRIKRAPIICSVPLIDDDQQQQRAVGRHLHSIESSYNNDYDEEYEEMTSDSEMDRSSFDEGAYIVADEPCLDDPRFSVAEREAPPSQEEEEEEEGASGNNADPLPPSSSGALVSMQSIDDLRDDGQAPLVVRRRHGNSGGSARRHSAYEPVSKSPSSVSSLPAGNSSEDAEARRKRKMNLRHKRRSMILETMTEFMV